MGGSEPCATNLFPPWGCLSCARLLFREDYTGILPRSSPLPSSGYPIIVYSAGSTSACSSSNPFNLKEALHTHSVP